MIQFEIKTVSGFLPEERAWLDGFMKSGFIDSFRHFNKEPHHYSWWSYRAGARGNNKGWRIDYYLVSEPLKDRIKKSRYFTRSQTFRPLSGFSRNRIIFKNNNFRNQ